MPTGGYRFSRALWDEARRPGAPKTALVRAILYELQPVKYSTLRRFWHRQAKQQGSIQTTWLFKFFTERVPSLCQHFYKWIRTWSWKSWMILAGVILYYFAIRAIHELLEAGPIVLILTALVAIFTYGLGEDNHDNPDRLSAYSVFNRGFQRLMGSVDVDELVNQHVGGGAMGMAMMNQHNPEEEDIPPAAAPADNHNNNRARRRNNNNNAANADDTAAAAAAAPNDNAAAAEANNNNRARKTGKKARRQRDIQQRRELQRQRQLAMEMGFDGGAGAADDDVAMQLYIEQQIAAENNAAAR